MKKTLQNKGKDLGLDVLYDLAGTLFFVLGINTFTAPSEIAPGGVSGVAIIIHYLTGMPIGTMTLLLNVPLLLLAYKFLGRNFTLKTMKSVVIMNVLMDVCLPVTPVYQGDPILAGLFGGVLTGLGMGVVFLRGSTTGGVDIASRLLQLKFPHMQIGRLIMMLDAVVLMLSALVFRNIETVLYGMIAIFASSQVVDSVMYGVNTGQVALIISGKQREIADKVIEMMGRGVTFLNAEGAYSGENRQVIFCAMRKQEFPKLKMFVDEVDPEAFLVVCEANEILGYGFRPIRPRN